METLAKIIGYTVAIVGLIVIVGCLFALGSWVTMWAWNIALVPLFHTPSISWAQAIAIDILLMSIKGLFSITIRNKE